MIKFQILGNGCAKCMALGQHTAAAAQALGLGRMKLEKVTDMNAIIDAGVMSTPALTVNGEVKSTGKVLSVDEIKTLLT